MMTLLHDVCLGIGALVLAWLAWIALCGMLAGLIVGAAWLIDRLSDRRALTQGGGDVG